LYRHLIIALTFVTTPVAAQTSARAALLSADLDLSNATFANGPARTIPNALGIAGVLVWPGAAALRGDSIAKVFLGRQPLVDSSRMSWQPLRIEISPDSSFAVLSGVAIVDRPAVGPATQIHRIGRYMAAWRRVAGVWQLEAFGIFNLFLRGEMVWTGANGPATLPLIHPAGLVGDFVAADSGFAASAGAIGASKAFTNWSAPDGVTFAATGELNVGPARIGAVLQTNTNHWDWGTVAAGASDDGALGWTIGQASITPPGSTTAPILSNLLTFWRRLPDGTIRFSALNASRRP
jgi:hypothetical protein